MYVIYRFFPLNLGKKVGCFSCARTNRCCERTKGGKYLPKKILTSRVELFCALKLVYFISDTVIKSIMDSIKMPFTEPQLDLLRMFSHKVNDSNWVEIKKLIAAYFATKAIEEANRVWDEKEWDDKKIDSFLKMHLKTPYRKP